MSYATEGRQKRYLRHAFRHYLSPAVIARIVDDPEELRLGGERKVLSLFFSDLAGFTTIGERMDPEELTRLLGEYLNAMTAVIHDEQGTVDKYVGDAIVSFWNAPEEQPDHAARALRAGIRSLERLEEINPALREKYGVTLAARVGIHTGSVVAGNLGSAERFDYSVIGDAANLASRLEGLGKVFRTPILVSETTVRAAEGIVDARLAGIVRVAGRRKATRVFRPVRLIGEPALHDWWSVEKGEAFDRALDAFLRGDLPEAMRGFEAVPEDPTAGAYLDRCREISRRGCPDRWSGVWEIEAK